MTRFLGLFTFRHLFGGTEEQKKEGNIVTYGNWLIRKKKKRKKSTKKYPHIDDNAATFNHQCLANQKPTGENI
jgi:hypothetical protein